jgi:hypothetical protein
MRDEDWVIRRNTYERFASGALSLRIASPCRIISKKPWKKVTE